MTRYVLAAGRPILLRPDGAVQLGWDPRRAVLVRPPTEMSQVQLTDLLRALQGGTTRDELIAAAESFDDDTIDELIAALTEAGMLTVTAAPRGRPGRHPSACTVADRCRNCWPTACAAQVPGSGTAPTPHQVGSGRHRPGGAGRLPGHRPATAPRTASRRNRPPAGAGARRRRLVGPLVIPGRTSCLQCADLHRTDRDAAWPAVATQLRVPSAAPTARPSWPLRRWRYGRSTW